MYWVTTFLLGKMILASRKALYLDYLPLRRVCFVQSLDNQPGTLVVLYINCA